MVHLFTVKHHEKDDTLEHNPNNPTDTHQEADATNSSMSSSPPSKKLKANSELTWADLYPLTKEKDPQPDEALVARIDKVRELLKEIKISVDNRELLIELARKNPLYDINSARNQLWKEKALSDNHVYYAIQKQVDRIGNLATRGKVRIWETDLEKLRLNTLNQVDVIADNDWWDEWPEDEAKVFKKDWNWKDATGKGPGLEEPVDPKSDDVNPNKDAGKYSHLFHQINQGFRWSCIRRAEHPTYHVSKG